MKIIEFTADWRVSPNGYDVVEFQCGDITEVDDQVADDAVASGVGTEVSEADLKKAVAGHARLVKAAEKAEADADAAEKAAIKARDAAIAARLAAARARVNRANAADDEPGTA